MGRMGNQMFQYACAKNMDFQFEYSTSMSHLDKLEFFKLYPFERIINKLKSFLFFRLAKPIWGMDILNTELKCLEKSYLDSLKQIQKPTMVWGFFQSPLYFHFSEKSIKKAFAVKRQYTKGFNDFIQKNQLLKGNYLVVHLRRTDYKGFTVPALQGDDFTLPISYYKNAMQQIKEDVIAKMPIVFVSDDPDSIESLFPEFESKIISRGDAITDFLILQHAGHMIISNSTFAWWAAYLNDNSTTNIFCPKYFLGFKENKEIPIDIYPKDWIQVSV